MQDDKCDRRRGGGRPRKYDAPCRPITVTLPESALAGLQQVDPDRGKAIVKLTEAAMGNGTMARPLVEVVKMTSHSGIIVVGPSETLRAVSFLHLVEVAPGRFLLAMDKGHDFKSLELALRDLLDDLQETEDRERRLIAQLLEHIRNVRVSDRVSMANILFVRPE